MRVNLTRFLTFVLLLYAGYHVYFPDVRFKSVLPPPRGLGCFKIISSVLHFDCVLYNCSLSTFLH